MFKTRLVGRQYASRAKSIQEPFRSAEVIGRFGPRHQASDVFKSTCGVSTHPALVIKQRSFGECQRGGAVDQPPFGCQAASVSGRRPHVAGFHLDGDNT